jgi:uncharacterized protein YbjQ (UPF0145 family)
MENGSFFLDIILPLAPIWFPILIFAVFYTTGKITESRHYKSIENREAMYLNKPAVTIAKQVVSDENVEMAWLVSGSVVIGQDHFKQLLAMLRNIVGGRIKSYETLIDRARREAVLRMKKKAAAADIIVNLRLETATIAKQSGKKSIGSVEAFAYGTAIKYKNI